MAKREKASYTIQSVAHALQLLEQFNGEPDGIGVTELSRRLKLHKNNVFRLLATLETRGYVVQDLETEYYRLGVRAYELGRAYLRQTEIVSVARPLLGQLVEQTSETAYLSVLQREDVVYLIGEASPRSVRVASRIGEHVPAHVDATGRAILAFREPFPYTDHPLRRRSDPSPSEVRKLQKLLARIRQQGYSADFGEADADVTTIAAPVFGPDGDVVGALSLSAPNYRAPRARHARPLIDALVDVAQAATAAMGGSETDDVTRAAS